MQQTPLPPVIDTPGLPGADALAGPGQPPGATDPAPDADPRLQTFADVDTYVATHPHWSAPSRRALRSTCRLAAWSVHAIQAARRQEPFDPEPKHLDLARVAFDIPAINAAWHGRSYRAAGFESKSMFRNARWAIRHVGRAAGQVLTCFAAPLPPGHPFAALEAGANKYDKPTVRRFVAWCDQTGRSRDRVGDDTLLAYRTFMAAHMVGRKTEEVIRLIARLWNSTAQADPDWPRTRLSAPRLTPPYSLPLTAYPDSLRRDITAFTDWMAGTTRRRHAPGRRPGRKRAQRPATIRGALTHIRLAAAALVAGGRDPASITHLGCLVGEAELEAILEYHETRAAARQQALAEDERRCLNALTQAIGNTLLMIARHHCELPPETLTALHAIAADFRTPQAGKPTLKNRRRISQLLDDRGRLNRLMRLPRTLMGTALALRQQASEAACQATQADRAEAARLNHRASGLARQAASLGREAALIGILCRIPLRIKNLHEIQIGPHLRFTGAGNIVTLHFTAAETKNRIDLEFYIGPRLRALLLTYIDLFLPHFAAGSADAAPRWLFPSGDGRAGPITIGRLRVIIVRSIADHVGVTMNPHLFRGLAVTLALEHAPAGLEHCRLLLGDKTPGAVQRHYVLLQEKDAARRQSALVDAEEDRLAQDAALPPARRRRRPA